MVRSKISVGNMGMILAARILNLSCDDDEVEECLYKYSTDEALTQVEGLGDGAPNGLARERNKNKLTI